MKAKEKLKPLSKEDIDAISKLEWSDRNFGAGLHNICISHELLRARIKRLEEALEFYANPRENIDAEDWLFEKEQAEVDKDGNWFPFGYHARKALEESE